MSDLNRRSVLTLGAALGLTSIGTAPAWSWSPAGSVAGAGSGADPEYVWDPEIDGVIRRIIEQGQVPAINSAMRSWVNNNDPIPAAFPDDLKAWLGRTNKLPAWADMGKLRRAADLNRRFDTYLFMVYGIGAGIMSTVIPREAKSVYWSFGGADMKDRAAKTFTFGYDMAQLTACEPRGQFIVTANKTRMVHAAVRHLLPQSPHWQAVADESIPISQADILVTFHSLGTFAHKKFTEWKVRWSAADKEAFLHHWQVAISLLGVEDQYIPKTWAECYAQSEQVLTPILAPTYEGKELAEVLLGLTAEIDHGLTRGFLNEFVRYMLGDEIGNWLNLRRDVVSRGIIRAGWPAYIAFRTGTIPFAPAGYYLFDQLVRAFAMAFLNEGQSTQTTLITLPEMNRPS